MSSLTGTVTRVSDARPERQAVVGDAVARHGGGPDDRTRAQFLAARASYDMTRHMESGTSHAAAVTPELIDRFGIAGPPDYCVERIRAVQRLGFDRLVIPGQLMGGDHSQDLARKLLLEEVLPNIR